LEDRRDENKVFRRVWKAVETKAREVRMVKAKKPRKERTMKVKKVARKWDIWDKEEKVAKFKEEAKKLIPQRFYK